MPTAGDSGGHALSAAAPAAARMLSVSGRDQAALVYVAELRGRPACRVEFVDALDPRYPRDEKWVIIVSSQFGCPIGCVMCETGGWFEGNLRADEILWQVDRVVDGRCPDRRIRARKFKVQLARMGEPALNPATLEALAGLAARYHAPGLIACVATVAPATAGDWFEELLLLKRRLYRQGAFQLQFSINTTDQALRDRLMPVRKWGLAEIAAYSSRFFEPGDRKVVLNFALAQGWPVDVETIARLFSPLCALIKLTPLNPTSPAEQAGLRTLLSNASADCCDHLVAALAGRGFETIVSIGSDEEIAIRSNCGQAVAVGRAARQPSATSPGW